MSNKIESKEDVLLYLNERIERQKNFIRIARKRGQDLFSQIKTEKIYEYGLGLLMGIKEDISK